MVILELHQGASDAATFLLHHRREMAHHHRRRVVVAGNQIDRAIGVLGVPPVDRVDQHVAGVVVGIVEAHQTEILAGYRIGDGGATRVMRQNASARIVAGNVGEFVVPGLEFKTKYIYDRFVISQM